jgi:hypothetical protein
MEFFETFIEPLVGMTTVACEGGQRVNTLHSTLCGENQDFHAAMEEHLTRTKEMIKNAPAAWRAVVNSAVCGRVKAAEYAHACARVCPETWVLELDETSALRNAFCKEVARLRVQVGAYENDGA